MADNVDITAGTGTTIATDDCTTGHVQLTKLAYGADGNRTHVPADADGLLVNLGANNDTTVTSTVTASSRTGSGTIDANGETVSLAIPGCGTAVVNVTGTWSGTAWLEASPDGGTDWRVIPRIDPETGGISVASFTSNASNGCFIVP